MAAGVRFGITRSLDNWRSAGCRSHLIAPTAANALFLLVVFPSTALIPATAPAADPDNATVSIRATPFAPISAPGEKPFTRIEGEAIGVYRPVEFSFKDLWEPFWNSRGVSSGDFDNDGDEDLVLASTDRGLHLFENTGTGQFTEVKLQMGIYSDLPAFLAAFVDLNNDGWLDLFLSGYQAGLFVVWNENGAYSFDRIQRVANRQDAVLSQALAFGDVDQDGDLDVAVGNWASGWYRRIPGAESTNRIIFNDAGTITGADARELDAFPGETLTILLSDIDLDGDLDLLEGNDFTLPDMFYFGDGTGDFRRIRSHDDIIPISTYSTMSMKTADLDNDLIPEIYISQIAGRADGISEKLKLRPIELFCSDIQNEQDRKDCQVNIDIKKWYHLGGRQVPVTEAFNCKNGDAKFEAECKAMMIKDVAIQSNKPALCRYIQPSQPRAALLCDIHFRPFREPTSAEMADNIPFAKGGNVMLVRQPDGTYVDRAKQTGLEIGGWSWDVKIEDFDLDEYRDIYVTNGYWLITKVSPSNLFYKSTDGREYHEVGGEYGLEEYLILSSVTAFDMDNDGDRDMIGQAVNGPVIAFINNAQNPNRIAFALRDEVGNRYGIGSRIVIHYGDNRSQMHELQLGGGFQSFDTAKSVFGLGSHSEVARVEVFWSTGEHTDIAGPLKTGAIYTISRKPEPQ
jgi:hypothetical protein